jgi:zinc transporter ZupT
VEARSAGQRAGAASSGRAPAWLLGLLPLLLIGALVGLLTVLGDGGLGGREGPPVERLAFEKTALRPGEIQLTVRNEGPDAVRIAQAAVNDGFTDFSVSDPDLARLEAGKVRIAYPWLEGESYTVDLLTSTGGKLSHTIDSATETPEADLGFFRLMALLGFYVGVLPVAIGMLWLPFVRRIEPRWLSLLMAVTVGLLGFLAIAATIEGLNVAGSGSQALGGPALVFLGAATSYLLLAGVAAWIETRRGAARATRVAGSSLALLVAVAIGLHNLGEGLAIGSAYAVGALALGAFLVIGFALHNTTEGLAIVAPVAAQPPSLRRLALLGLIAGAPAILGAWIGAAAFNSSVAAFLLGAGAGAIAQVIQQLVPSIRDGAGRAIHPASVAGILAGFAVLYATSLLVAV